MQITIEGTDFVQADTATKDVTAFIAATVKAEAFVHANACGNSCRSAFGLTLYTHNEQERYSMTQKAKAAGLSIYYAFV